MYKPFVCSHPIDCSASSVYMSHRPKYLLRAQLHLAQKTSRLHQTTTTTTDGKIIAKSQPIKHLHTARAHWFTLGALFFFLVVGAHGLSFLKANQSEQSFRHWVTEHWIPCFSYSREVKHFDYLYQLRVEKRSITTNYPNCYTTSSWEYTRKKQPSDSTPDCILFASLCFRV